MAIQVKVINNKYEFALRKFNKEMSARIEKADGFKAKQPLLKKRQQIQMKIKDINRRLGR